VAKQGEDPDVIAATMAAPGVVLKPSVGCRGAFKEHAELPTDLARDGTSRKPGYTSASQKPHRHPPRTDGKAALAIEKEQKRRDGGRRRQEAARQRDRERRERATAKAHAALDNADREHAKAAADIQAEVEALEKRSRAEDDRWEREKERASHRRNGLRPDRVDCSIFMTGGTHMRWTMAAACAAAISVAGASAADAKGCIKGAIVGGVAGHMMGHGKLGAVAGCVVGHHEANKKNPNNANAQQQAPSGQK
jgi:hypothetical protein